MMIRPAVCTLLCALLLVLLLTNPAAAGAIDPDYERELTALADGKQVSVLIFLADQVPIRTLDEELRAKHAALAVRHERVITALQAMAEDTQGPLLAHLAAEKVRGEVTSYAPYWIANLVVARMSAAAVRQVAARSDVDVVSAGLGLAPATDAKTQDPPSAADRETAFTGSTPGLRAINAHRVWYDLGITGEGRLVCGLDTGVMGSHPALASQWRGVEPGIPWQWTWKDLIGGDTQFPIDTNGHGTHTMGTLVGLAAATQDTIGVAWGAQWIACNAINQGPNTEFDQDVIAAFQWVADPDGDPQTIEDVPDVVVNSWGVNELFGYLDCDSRWWAVIDGCEAAGCAVMFAAGGNGPGAQTIESPADRITTPTNAFAIGAVSAQAGQQFPYSIASFSGRGPSGCDGVTKKPEVVAPGVNVLSSTNDGGYAQWSGTGMAAPHVAGVIALMRQADPDLDVTTAKQIILETARDEGTPGEDNTYGWGIIDAYAAVSRVLATQGIRGGAPRIGFALAVRPNPSNPNTVVSYAVPAGGRVELRVFDIQGRWVRTLVDAIVEPGSHHMLFDCRNDRGAELPSGTYFLHLEAGNLEATEKLGLIR
jgi:bacillopeptidase F